MVYIGNHEMQEDKSGRSIAFYSKKTILKVTLSEIDSLIKESKKRKNADVRLNLHSQVESMLHQMVIVQHKGFYRRPHKHPIKEESYQMIKGKMALVFFNNNGDLTSSTILDKSSCFIYRIPKNCWHATLPLTPIVVFHEVRTGPYIRSNDLIYAPWSPDEKNMNKITEFMEEILIKLKSPKGK